jgi:hypothetical protein
MSSAPRFDNEDAEPSIDETAGVGGACAVDVGASTDDASAEAAAIDVEEGAGVESP